MKLGGESIGEEVVKWSVDFVLCLRYFDMRVIIEMLFDDLGVYLIIVKMKDGNLIFIVVWIVDMVILWMIFNGKLMYFVVDVKLGDFLVGVNIEFFGFW